MGGEKTKGGGPEKSGLGSPPRGRGKVGHSVISTISSGITPAWAGKSLFDMVINSLLEDHPRVGGEKFQKPIDMLQDMGSPPRGRGKVLEFALVFRWCRITPAWAGKSRCHFVQLWPHRDHPRVGGEKKRTRASRLMLLGSPPRGRGKGRSALDIDARVGITPAWAGKRLKRSHRSGIFISGPIPFHSVLHRPAGSGGSRAGRDGSPAGQPQNTGPA